MRHLSRDEHCALAGIEIEAFKSLHRRQLVPWALDERKAYQGYTPFETLMLIMNEEFCNSHTISRERAANIVSGADVILPQWARVVATSKQLVEGRTPKAEIMFGRVDLPSGKGQEAVCGTFAEIAREHPSPVRFVGISVSRTAAVMRIRAANQGINLEDFWKLPAMGQAIKPVKPRARRPS